MALDNLENILDEWTTDCNIDHLEPGKELLKIPSLHAKYLKILIKHKILLKKAKNEMAAERKIKYGYYNGHYNTDKAMLTQLGLEPFKFILKQDVTIYLESDKEMVAISDRITYHEEIIRACEFILGELKTRGWGLKGHIDWEKFVNGI